MGARDGYCAWQSALWPSAISSTKGGHLSPSPLWGGVGEGSFPNATTHEVEMRGQEAPRVQPAVSFGRQCDFNTGDSWLKARRIPLGLLYVAALVAVIVLIPLCRFAGSPASTLTHRQSSAMTLRLDNLKL
jgi:hypothetical protein